MRASLIFISFFFLVFGAWTKDLEPVHFVKQKIKVGEQTLEVEVADNSEKWARGLMYRKEISKNAGMLFIFKDSKQRSFWMKNTFVPLSIGFFDDKGILFDIQNMDPVKSEIETPKSYASKGAAKYALEVNQGWFDQNKISVGAELKFIDQSPGL